MGSGVECSTEFSYSKNDYSAEKKIEKHCTVQDFCAETCLTAGERKREKRKTIVGA